MTNTTTTTPAPGFFAGVVAWLKQKAADVGAWLSQEETVAVNAVKTEVAAIAPEVIAAFDNLFGQLSTFAIASAKEVEQAAIDGDILSTEKRSTLFTTLEQKAQSLGYSVGQQGVTAGLNLLTEFGANVFKMITGNSVAAPANA